MTVFQVKKVGFFFVFFIKGELYFTANSRAKVTRETSKSEKETRKRGQTDQQINRQTLPLPFKVQLLFNK